VGFGTINIDDVVYEEFNNASFYDIIRDKLLKNNMLSSILTE